LVKIVGHFLNEIRKDKSANVSKIKLRIEQHSTNQAGQPFLFCPGEFKDKIKENLTNNVD
jgi:hypothetical protein